VRAFFFGDSICFGQFVSPHLTWVTRIARRLAEPAPSGAGRPEVTVINTSISGNTTRMALERMPFDVQSHGIDVILIQFGMNDCNYWLSDGGQPRVSRRAFEANLLEIVARARAFGARQIMLNTNHPTPRTAVMEHAGVSYQRSNEQYNEVVRAVAEQSGGVRLIDIEREWLARVGRGEARLEDLLLEDHIHLSERGHALYFEIVYPVYERAVLSL